MLKVLIHRVTFLSLKHSIKYIIEHILILPYICIWNIRKMQRITSKKWFSLSEKGPGRLAQGWIWDFLILCLQLALPISPHFFYSGKLQTYEKTGLRRVNTHISSVWMCIVTNGLTVLPHCFISFYLYILFKSLRLNCRRHGTALLCTSACISQEQGHSFP